MESAKCRLLLSEKLKLDRCKNCSFSSLGYRFVGGELVLLHSASDCSNFEKSVSITNFFKTMVLFKNKKFNRLVDLAFSYVDKYTVSCGEVIMCCIVRDY